MLQLGDVLTEGETLQFTGLPFFAPELFQAVEVKDPLRTKQLRTGLTQLGEEGAIQVFRPEAAGGSLLLGAVGQLQFEVVATGSRPSTAWTPACCLRATRWRAGSRPTTQGAAQVHGCQCCPYRL